MAALRRAFVALSIAWAALLPLAPFAASQPAPAQFWYGLAFIVYGAGSSICHQLPARSFFQWSAQFPVCARCTGIYLGAALAAIFATVRPTAFAWATARLKSDITYASHRTRGLLALGALPTAMSLLYEWTTGDTPSNAIRALAGAPLGAAVGFGVVNALATPRPVAPRSTDPGGVRPQPDVM